VNFVQIVDLIGFRGCCKRWHGGSICSFEANSPSPRPRYPRRVAMLHYTVVFLIVALIAALLGFTGIAGAAASIAKILFFVFLVLFVISLVLGRRSASV
jgi:uncharacterized membrane protein YtjA (UPF0391 family)